VLQIGGYTEIPQNVTLFTTVIVFLQNRENGAILPFPWNARKLQGFQLQGGFAP